jgi:CheY-like chemotaxis protein
MSPQWFSWRLFMATAPQVLVVEDNATEQRVLALLLNKFGMDSTIARTGTAAIELARDPSRHFDVILMDWQLADMDGLECTRRIREFHRQQGRTVPIVAVTARAMLGDKQKCLNAGMDDYLSKPFTALQFENMLRQWVGREASLTG